MKKLGFFLLAGAVIMLIFAWTFDFPGERVTSQRWDAAQNRWGPTVVVKDETRPLRWMFSIIGGGIFLAGGVLVGFYGPRQSRAAH